MPLPKDILVTHIKNEITECKRSLKHHIDVSDPTLATLSVKLGITIVDIPGPILRGETIKHKYTHKLSIIITDNYPYQIPIVRWRSEIFHPNIMTPEDDSLVCTKLLDDWNFRSTLFTFITGIKCLLSDPNPDSPFENDSCTRAAEYFYNHP
jgi:ubiquitin-conjugating enzyme E2 C